ncbi:LAMI_0E00122g1_1 [Lachancea mirantina]|uniref:LAMI_0E00122g1_1 n=1 Tax=Lachancea mirantina TaxID=1230905 RepID=A0A1G4JHV4_9SACH|nr:LAMI_0E00122g1_1 [Lachancea mirantina]
MPISSLPATLNPALSGREAVLDALYRYLLAFDINDKALFESAFTEDAVFVMDGTVMDGRDAVKAQTFDVLSKLETTHFLTNPRINILDGDMNAELTCSALAQHYRQGEGKGGSATPLLAGSLYHADLVKSKEDGLWKIKRLDLNVVWGQGDWGVFGQ